MQGAATERKGRHSGATLPAKLCTFPSRDAHTDAPERQQPAPFRLNSTHRLLLPALLLCLLFPPIPANAGAHRSITDPNAGTINGYVQDEQTDETLVLANVVIKETGIGTTTNKSGFFSISDVPPGAYTLVASYLGYRKQAIPVTVRAGQTVTLTIELLPEAVQVGEVTIEGQRRADEREISVSRVNIPAAQLSQIRIGGESDIFRSLQFLPGILASSQISSGLYIRGGSPDQTLVLLDGSTVYNPSHLFGFFSTFNPDAIKDVDLIKGGYPAEYGGRMSAVLDLVQKDGNRHQTEGLASLGLISSRLSVHGPIGDGSWFVGGRRTYIDLITNALETESDPLPDYYFYDVNAKISQSLGPSDRVFASGFLSRDNLTMDSRSGFAGELGIDNRAANARWTHLFSDNIFSTFNLSWSRYMNGFTADASGFTTEVENGIQDYTLKGNVEWFAGNDLTVKAGLEASHYIFTFGINFTGEPNEKSEKGTNEGGVVNLEVPDEAYSAFAQANYRITPVFSVQTGLRANRYAMRNLTTFDPRIALRYQLDADVAVKAAWGLYHQYFRLASMPDFSFFDTWFPTDSTVDPGQATHYVLGIETSPLPDLDLNVDCYYKSLRHVAEYDLYVTQARTVRELFLDGRGESFGFEIFAQKKVGRFTGWIGYALGFTSSQFPEVNEGRWFRPRWDRRHDAKIVAQYRLTDRWDIGATFSFQSGQSYTGMTSRTESRMPGDNVGRAITFPAERYGLRLPPSHQLNLNVNYNSTLFDLPMRLLIDIFNVYSRRDIWFRYYDTNGKITEVTDVRLLPILPSIALEVKF